MHLEELADAVVGDVSVEIAGRPEGQLDRAVESYRAHYSAEGLVMSRPYPGVLEMLESLRVAGVRASVATSKRLDFAQRMVDHLGLGELMEVVSGAQPDNDVTTKAQIVGQALEWLKEPDRATTWMVGDRRDDVEAALDHELTPLGALWGYGSRSELVQAGAKRLLARPDELTTAIRGVRTRR